MIKQASVVLAALVVVSRLSGQTYEPKEPNKRVAAAMGLKLIPAKCSPKGDNQFMVSSVKTYMNSSFEAADASDKAKFMRKANEVAQTAIKDGQDKNGGAWYWLGRVFLQQGDVPGADSALKRAQALLPDCAQEIKAFRAAAYQALVGPATQKQRENAVDSALWLYRQANMMSSDYPNSFLNMAVAFSDTYPDSALMYFKLAEEKAMADQKTFHNERDAAVRNLAVIYQAKGNDKEAVLEAQKILTWNPTDPDAKRFLYNFLARSKDPADAPKAKAIQEELLKLAESEGTITAGELARQGIDQFNGKNFQKAADYFGKALEKEPWRRDILFNQTSAYYSLEDYPKVMAGLEKQLESEPLNNQYYLLLISASQKMSTTKADTARTLDIGTRYFALVSGLSFDPLNPNKDGADLKGEAVGLEASDAKGKTILAAPVTIVFEFLDKDGKVVSTSDFTIPALQPEAKAPVAIKATGKGIVDWRYHVKP